MKKLLANLLVVVSMIAVAASASAQSLSRSVVAGDNSLVSGDASTPPHVVRVTPNAGQSTGPSSIAYSALREELLKRRERDQAIRNEWIKKGADIHDAALEARMADIDAGNTARMKEIVKQFGWPGPELVGEDGVDAAFLLVQHADYAFQKEMLPLVRDAYRAHKLSGQNYALLLDRVLVTEGKPQVYGTQAKSFDKWSGTEPALEPIEDEANVDKRRAEVGLPPLAEYLVMLKQMYFPKDKNRNSYRRDVALMLKRILAVQSVAEGEPLSEEI